jgi:predicted acyl esterase
MNGPYGDITCAVYAIGGWADAYTNAIPRLLEGLTCPRKGLIGPWAHNYPEEGVPEPAIGFNQECLRWWDYWLKGIDTSIMDEPMLRSYILEGIPPAPTQVTWPGKWVADTAWPPPTITNYQLLITNNGLSKTPSPEFQLAALGAQANGLNSGVWCAYGLPGDFPPDQRNDDALSLCFDSAPLDSSLDILGFPEVTLTVSVNQPNALIAVRLCDVSPTGSSALITRGLLNLTHRDSHEHPSPVEPGKRYTVTVKLNAIGYSVAQGHRIRVAVSPTYWPFAWPSPKPVTLTLFTGHLNLPIRSPQPADEILKPFEPPEISTPLALKTLRAPNRKREIQRDVISGAHTLVDHNDAGCLRYPDGLGYDNDMTDTYTIVEGDPLSAMVRCERSAELRRGDWRTRIQTSSVMTSDATTFRVTNSVDAYEGETRIFSKTWTFTAPRDHM